MIAPASDGVARRTKIVATVGPASRSPETLAELIAAGVDVFRLNFAHGSAEDQAEAIRRIRSVSESVGREVGILGDLPGPKLRLGDLEGDVAVLHSGSTVIMRGQTDGAPGNPELLPVQWEGFAKAVSEGDPVFLADGRVRLRVASISGADVTCEVEAGGAVSSHQGVNLPRADTDLPETGASDEPWIDFACENGVDLLAVSFVRRPSDLGKVETRLREREADIPLIAKIEKPQGAERAEEIIQAAGSGIMIARGDLGVELPIEEVPGTQKRLIALAGRASKPSITATQMLATMVRAARPTRAEVTDVANAIYDGTDAVMLSEETAIGDHPVEAVRVMDRIARVTEPRLRYDEIVFTRVEEKEHDVAETVAQVAVSACYRLGLKAIVCPTSSGRTARLISAHRPRVPVLAVSPRLSTVRRMNLLFGVSSTQAEDWTSIRKLLDDCAKLAREHGIAESGDLVAITAGLPAQGVGTNLFEIHRVP
ncbi:MAG TPA: pyruvate kinase [Solirubrobacterales bacterium]|nr:pyruvate kinase [Solirubrobacterales bacterium]